VADDIRVVCAELQLPQSVATALCAAAAKGQVSCNPGILLSQVRLRQTVSHTAHQWQCLLLL
jgi:hypothetical protein